MNGYNSDKEFLAKHFELVELSAGEKRVLLTPSLQGRVMTCCSSKSDEYSFGWLNYNLIASGEVLPHCNNWGGEDRFWLGPEGGQNAIFFKKGTSRNFDFEDWQAPSLIDTDAWDLVSATDGEASFAVERTLENYQGTALECRLERKVAILSDEQIEQELGAKVGESLSSVGFVSHNSLTNIGKESWSHEGGALSIWILGQFPPSEQNDIIIPTKESAQAVINDVYFGKVPADRLSCENGCYYFKGDGNMRGKIGIPPEMTVPMVFALDKENGVLTVVKFSFEADAKEYINSLWEWQDEPFKGDVINSYNDGPLEDGTVMGGFYEIETSSKALLLSAGESHTHTSTTIHIKGEVAQLQEMLTTLLAKI